MPDVRLIDANAIVEKLKSYYEALSPDVQSELIRRDEVSSCIAELINAPTIDAQPVKRGKWSEYSRNALETYIECTNCCVASRPIHLQMVTINGSGLPDYCPNCGADMRGDKDGR